MKHHSRFARVEECQDYGMVRSVDRRVNIQLIWQGTRGLDTFFLRRHAEDHLILFGFERLWEVEDAHELCVRREKTIGVRQADGNVIRVLKVKHGRHVTSYRT